MMVNIVPDIGMKEFSINKTHISHGNLTILFSCLEHSNILNDRNKDSTIQKITIKNFIKKYNI